MAAKAQARTKQTKGRKKGKFPTVTNGIVHISSTFNNTHILFTDEKGGALAFSSAGGCGFKGSRKSTPFAAQVAAEDACRKVEPYGMRNVQVVVKGPGSGRESALRSLQIQGLEVSSIVDATPVPHNGCRPRKRRRV